MRYIDLNVELLFTRPPATYVWALIMIEWTRSVDERIVDIYVKLFTVPRIDFHQVHVQTQLRVLWQVRKRLSQFCAVTKLAVSSENISVAAALRARNGVPIIKPSVRGTTWSGVVKHQWITLYYWAHICHVTNVPVWHDAIFCLHEAVLSAQTIHGRFFETLFQGFWERFVR